MSGGHFCHTYLYICLSMLHEIQNEVCTTGGVRAQFESGQQFGSVHQRNLVEVADRIIVTIVDPFQFCRYPATPCTLAVSRVNQRWNRV